MLQPFTLSNGQFIPAGVTIEVPTVAVNADSNVFEDAEKFDALRFYRVRQQAKETGSAEGAALNQFVSVSQSSLTFGYGRHACPGRFFAANELKMVMANALLKYDIKNADGRKERYPNIEFGHMVSFLPAACVIWDPPPLTILGSAFPIPRRSCFSRSWRCDGQIAG